jgi:hypothetical protein
VSWAGAVSGPGLWLVRLAGAAGFCPPCLGPRDLGRAADWLPGPGAPAVMAVLYSLLFWRWNPCTNARRHKQVFGAWHLGMGCSLVRCAIKPHLGRRRIGTPDSVASWPPASYANGRHGGLVGGVIADHLSDSAGDGCRAVVPEAAEPKPMTAGAGGGSCGMSLSLSVARLAQSRVKGESRPRWHAPC